MSEHDRKRQGRKLSEEERVLWARITRSVAPLGRRPASPMAPSAASEAPASRAGVAGRGVAPAAKAAPPLASFDRRQKQRLARGTESIDARLDLHGKSQSEAHAALLRFLSRAQRNDAKFVLVITGKGGRARRDEHGVLKRQVPQWLTLPEFRPYVVGFERAHIGHGGEGALYVRVRKAAGRRRTVDD